MDYNVAIDALAECGALSSSLEAEHDAIDSMLRTLNKVMLACAAPPLILRIADLAIDYCRDHFDREERFIGDRGGSGLLPHAMAHRQLVQRLYAVRAAINKGDPEATLETADLLEAVHRHIDTMDNLAYQTILQEVGQGPSDEFQRTIELTRLRRMAS